MAARVVIFAKAPIPGKVKTRLIPVLGADGAAALARQMLSDTLQEAASVARAKTELCVCPSPAEPAWHGILPDCDHVTAQGGGDLGQRLARAARRVIGEADHPVFIGTDCPALTGETIARACLALESYDAVIHPALDGGYVLLGLKRFDPSLFDGIAWSTASVAQATISRIEALGWSLHVGETLRDIDEPADLATIRPSPADPKASSG